MKKRQFLDVLIAGLALFAMFLGAGNIIFPPFVGVQAGSKWPLVGLGFLMTAAGLPLLGTLALAKLGGDSNRLCERAWPVMGKVLNTLIIIIIGPLFAIPRTAATTFELGLLPFLPENFPVKTVFFAVSAVFFLITWLLSQSEGKVLNAIGGVLAPILIVLLFASILLSILRPISTPSAPLLKEGFFYFGFSSGYQTMDGIGSLVMSGTIASLLFQKGYDKSQSRQLIAPIAFIAGLLLSAVYLGFLWIGASAGDTLSGIQGRTAMLSHAIGLLAGNYGRVLLAVIIFFACLTTSSGLVVTFANYFHRLLGGRVGYKTLVTLCTLISFALSLIGVEGIIRLSEPVLIVIYPICIVLVLLNLFSSRIRYDQAFRGALAGTMLVSLVLLLKLIPPVRPYAEAFISWLPLGSAGFGYLLPAVLGYAIGHFVASRQRRDPMPVSRPETAGKQP